MTANIQSMKASGYYILYILTNARASGHKILCIFIAHKTGWQGLKYEICGYRAMTDVLTVFWAMKCKVLIFNREASEQAFYTKGGNISQALVTYN